MYGLSVCKIFGPKIRSCKFFDKSQVWSQVSMIKEATIVSGDRVRGVPGGQPGQLGGDQLVPQLKQGHCQGGLIKF